MNPMGIRWLWQSALPATGGGHSGLLLTYYIPRGAALCSAARSSGIAGGVVGTRDGLSRLSDKPANPRDDAATVQFFPIRSGTDVCFHPARADRKSTRLNSSHDQISYAVFCLKKKKT